MQTFLQSTHVATPMIQFVFQIFSKSWNKRTSYLHLKKSKLSKENYRPVSILPNISKIYERCLYDQIATSFEDIFSRCQCGSCKVYSRQHCLLAMIEKWKKLKLMRVFLEHYYLKLLTVFCMMSSLLNYKHTVLT